MATIYKVQGYIVDLEDTFQCQDLEYAITRYYDCFTKHFSVKSADIGEWYDKHPLNYINCDITECEKYFKEG